ncbi:MAG: efflux RND transporter permease subunit [Myxococcales bacterium]|nr:efflux RND transporter permease subunit [Myxococcales bacterium]
MSWIEICIRHPVFTSMMIAAIFVFGIASYPEIGLDMLPNVDTPIVTVTTIYPGADPESVEKEISEKIEDALSNVAGIKTMRSISVENVSQLIVEFELEVKIDSAIQDVRDQIARLVTQLPSDAETPIITKVDPGSFPILTLTVSGPASVGELTHYTSETIKKTLQNVPGVGSVDIVGGQEREIHVFLDPFRLQSRNLAVTDVIGALAANNLDFPGGAITTAERELSVKVLSRFATLDEIRNLKIVEIAGQPIFLGDLGRVEDGVEERRTAAQWNGTNAVALVIRKQSGTNTIEVGQAIKKRLAEIEQSLPAGWEARVAVDQTLSIRAIFESVRFDLLFGGVLAILIVFVFLRSPRSTLIAALAIPTSIIGTFIFIRAMHFTFNTLTMVALSLSIGILIDDAIVMLENIYRHLEKGLPAREAAVRGAKEIGMAILATTLTIVAVFLPVAFMKGLIGRFFNQFGLTVSVAVLLSLFVSFTLTPMLCARFLRPPRPHAIYARIESVLLALDRNYRRLIGWALDHRKATIAIAVSVFLLSLGSIFLLNTTLSATTDLDMILVRVKLPIGSSLEKTETYAAAIAAKIRENKSVVSTMLTVGADAQKKQNQAEITVGLVPKNERKESLLKIIPAIQALTAQFPAAELYVSPKDIMDTGDVAVHMNQVEYSLKGHDLAALDDFSRRLVDRLRGTPGLTDFETTYEKNRPEVKLLVDREKAAHLGVASYTIGQTVNALVGGIEASKYRIGGDDYEIRVRLDEAARQNPAQLANLQVRNQHHSLVALSSIARIENGFGPTQIDREDRLRKIDVKVGFDSTMPMGKAIKLIQAAADSLPHPGIVTSVGTLAKVMGESFQSMYLALLLAVLIIYMVLASQFDSYIHPLTIMIALPLSLPGALGALLLSGDNLSIFAMIGVIMLMGLVTKNAILLVDYTNVLRRRDGMEMKAALLQAGPTRLRPILMTTAAMVFGMLPIVLSNGYGAEMRSSMGVCVIGGLLVSTLLTLVVVPVIYSLLDRFDRTLHRRA